jgi:pimeloyl-[acyl-carrier protein] methyl ester esterase
LSLHRIPTGTGPELVFVHGWGMNSAVWEQVSAHLQRRFRCTLIDLPGHGASPWGGEETLDEWAGACLDAAPDAAVWVAWSLGALVALRAAADAPGRIRALLAVSGTPRFTQSVGWPHAVAPATLQQFAGTLAKDHWGTLERFLALQIHGSDEARSTLRALKGLLRELPVPHPRALEVGLGLLQGTDLRTEAGALCVPSRWLLGDRDTLVPRGAAADLRRLIPGAEVELVHGAGHAPFLSHPAAFFAALDALAAELTP